MLQVPFQLDGSPQQLMVFDVTANGRPMRLALDTGAAAFVLQPRHADLLSFSDSGTATALGAGGKAQVRMGQLSTLAIAGMTFADMPVAITDAVEMVEQQLSTRIDGVIGYPLLKDKTLDIDFTSGVFRIDDDRVQGGVPITIPAAKPLLLLELPQGWFAIDTGASATVIGPAIASRLGLETSRAPRIFGAGGAIETEFAGPLPLTLGGRDILLPTVHVAGFFQSLQDAIGHPLEGVIGLDVLRQFRVQIDYLQRLLQLAAL